jgi:MFS family permease
VILARDHLAQEQGYIDDQGRREFIRFGVAAFLASLLNAHVALLSILFAQEGHSLHATGWLLSLFAIPVIGINLLAGPIAARIGVLATARLSFFFCILGFCSLAFTAQDFWGALASRLFHGVGFGLFLPSVMTYGQSRLNQRRFVGLVIVFSSLIPFAYAVGPAVGEFTLAHLGSDMFFLIALVPGVVGLVLTMGLRPLGKPENRGLALSGALKPRFVLPLTALFVGGTLHAYSLAYLPPDFVSRGLALALFFVPSTVATGLSRVSGNMFQRFQPRFLVSIGVAMMGVGLAAIAITDQIWLVVLGSILFGLGSSVLYPVVSAWLAQGIEPEKRAGPQAVGSAAFYLGLHGMPLPLAFLVEPAGYAVTSYLLAFVALIVAGALLVRGQLVRL